MIDVKNLVKRYPGHVALKGITFDIKEGEIVGFLGPNGSGKTTTIRILSCFMPATSGWAQVAGYDCFTESLKVRENLGYLPERVPLYEDMRVYEYLYMRAALKGIRWRDRRNAVINAVDKCWIGDVYTKMIRALSKGYRQRVGLADTLLTTPKVLILDEPTVGLDPVQLKQIRGIIKEYGQKNTVMLSTHILQEVEMMCDRVIMINKGQIIDEGTPAYLTDKYQAKDLYVAKVFGNRDAIESAIRGIPKTRGVKILSGLNGSLQGEHIFRVEAGKNSGIGQDLAELFLAQKWELREIRRERVSLEDVFVGIVYHQFNEWEREEFSEHFKISDLETLHPDDLKQVKAAADEPVAVKKTEGGAAS